MKIMKITRPQLWTGLMILGILGGMAMWLGYSEVATGCATGIVAILMKLAEKE